MAEVKDWPIAAASVTSGDDYDWRDGVARSLVKTNGRAQMAAVRRFHDAVNAVAQPATGAVARTAASRFSEAVSLKDFGAKMDRLPAISPAAAVAGTDDTAAFLAACAACAASGETLVLPRGATRITAGALIALDTQRSVGNSGCSLNIRGAGSSNSVLYIDGASGFTPFTFTSSNPNSVFRLSMSGFRIERAFSTFAAITNAPAIKLQNITYFTLDDVVAFGMGSLLENAGGLSSKIDNVKAYYCLGGISSYGYNGIAPNDISIRNSRFLSNRDFHIKMLDGMGLHIQDCDLEAVGDLASSVKGQCIAVQGSPISGAVVLTLSGCVYFENNYANYLIGIVPVSGLEQIYRLSGANFNRIGAGDVVLNDVLVSGNQLAAVDAKVILDVRGSAFNSIGSYVKSAVKPRVYWSDVNGYANGQFLSLGATGLDGVDGTLLPTNIDWADGPASRVFARSITNAAGTTYNTKDFTVAVTATGLRTYTYKRAVPNGFTAFPQACVTAASSGTGATVNVFNISNTSFVVQTFNAAGALTDLAHTVEVFLQ